MPNIAKAQKSYRILKEKIANRNAVVALLGLGRVGLPLAAEIAKTGFVVNGVDPDLRAVEAIKKGDGRGDVDDALLIELVKAGKLVPHSNPSAIAKCDVIIVCVPTPLQKRRELDLTYIEQATKTIAQYLRTPALVILESTTYPGTTEEVLQPVLEGGRRRYKVGEDFFLAHGPERLDPGNPRFNISNTTKLVGGVTSRCTDLAVSFYSSFVYRVRKMKGPREAEMAKLFENTFRNVNIGLVNELTQICSRMGLDVYDVLQGAATKEFGFMPFMPGPGVGGHCIPLDPYYLLWKSREYDVHPRFIELALDVNENMPYYVVDKLSRALNRRGKCINGSKILMLGLAYKAGTTDTRESPAIKIFELLEKEGARMSFHDALCEKVLVGDKLLRSAPLTPSLLRKTDAVVVAVAHPEVDYQMVAKTAPFILDTRFVFKQTRIKADKIEWL